MVPLDFSRKMESVNNKPFAAVFNRGLGIRDTTKGYATLGKTKY
ncbi:MAG: hypothetical protein ACI8YQ_005054 [Polaribacter sp.]